ncbi:MAG TPA: (d)CMP kinase, partial [Candidatus Limnocylindrales bacterium]|nr:(d)CMP kinase [Candidatus Limnocylindrales bacterium]
MAGRPSQTRRVVVALDGPASSGKSSVGSAAAAQLGLRFVDTGLFYRAVTALALLENVPVDDAAALVPLVDRIELADDGTGRLNRVLLDGMDATEEARGATVDSFVSTVARQPEVREALLGRQRMLAEAGGIVVAGRDIGTVVLPDADLKLYLDASVEARADRRIQERGLDPGSEEAEEVREQLAIRDAIDAGREVAPLRAADDAVHLDTDGNAFEDSVEIVAAEIARVMLTPRKRTRSKPSSSTSRTAAAAAAAAEALGMPVTEAVEAAPEPEISPEPEPEPAPVAAPEPVDPGPFAVGSAVAEVIAHPD